VTIEAIPVQVYAFWGTALQQFEAPKWLTPFDFLMGMVRALVEKNARRLGQSVLPQGNADFRPYDPAEW